MEAKVSQYWHFNVLEISAPTHSGEDLKDLKRNMQHQSVSSITAVQGLKFEELAALRNKRS